MTKIESFDDRSAVGGLARDPGVIAMAGPVARGMVALQAAHAAGLALLASQQAQQQAAVVSDAVACMTCAALLAFDAASHETHPGDVEGTAARPGGDPARALQAAERRAEPGGTVPSAEAAAGAGAQAILAQAAALAVEDSVIALRNASMVANAAAGACMARFLATGDSRYLDGAAGARRIVEAAIGDFEAIGAAAARMLDPDRPG